MLDVLILFPKSADEQELAEVLRGLIPNMKESPGLRSIRVSEGALMARGGAAPWSKVVEASFDSLVDWMERIPPPEQQVERDAFDRLKPVVLYFEAADA